MHAIAAVVTTLVLVVALASAALADTIVVDGDTVTVGANLRISGAACASRPLDILGDVRLNRNVSNDLDPGPGVFNHFTQGESLRVEASVPAGSGLTSRKVSATDPVITPWNTNLQAFDIPIFTTIPATTPSGTHVVTYTVTGRTSGYRLSGSFNVVVDCPLSPPLVAGSITGPSPVDEGSTHAYTSDASAGAGVQLGYAWSVIGDGQIAGGQGTASVTLDFGDGPGNAVLHLVVDNGSATASPPDLVIDVQNVPPSAPGAPFVSAGANPSNTGSFTLTWAASTDVSEDSVTYLLLHTDADDADYSVVASGLKTSSFEFTSGSPEPEGTWTYRVVAGDEDGGWSPASDVSNAVTVDRSAPNAPTLTPDRAPDYAAGGGWYRDGVTVSASGSGDPDLLDGSPGSGVDGSTLPDAQTFITSGVHTATATVQDLAGNISPQASLTVQVDATNPTVDITCPSPVILGGGATATWTASDTESGLATPAGGTMALNAATVGTHTVWAPQAMDHVGHLSDPAGCSYVVGYGFGGFLEPISNGGLNQVKAGQVVPIRWRLTDASGMGVTDPASFEEIVTVGGPCSGGRSDVAHEAFAGSSGLRYLGDGVWGFNWKVPKSYAGQCRTMYLILADESSTPAAPPVATSTRSANFVFR